MRLDEIVAWYQKKIGTYDKQQWEKTVEQKILCGFTGITLKTAKLKTEFIDVDLVRGSTFPKAKPKQSLLTVIRLAILRYFLLPIYAKWWVKQTSPKVFISFLLLYVSQMINWSIYTFHGHANDVENIVSMSELIIPMSLGLILSLIHSQIIATNIGNNSPRSRRKPIYNSNGKQRETIRRRKKLVRLRSNDTELNQCNKFGNKVNFRSDSKENLLKKTSKNSLEVSMSKTELENENDNNNISTNLTLETSISYKKSIFSGERLSSTTESATSICKKRNVNWDSPIQNFAVENNLPSNNSDCESSKYIENIENIANIIPTTVQNVEKPVSDFVYYLIDKCSTVEMNQKLNADKPNQIGIEDDGFESLNGKSSSGEENYQSFNPEINSTTANNNNSNIKNHLRLRLPLKNNYKNLFTEIEESETNNKDANETSTRNVIHRRKLQLSSESEVDKQNVPKNSFGLNGSSTNNPETKKKKILKETNDSSDTDEEGDDGDILSSSAVPNSNYVDCTTSTEWLGITTNSDECSYSSHMENSDFQHSDEDGNYDHDYTPTVILNPCGTSDRINCTIWDRHEIKKAELSVLDISTCIIERVEGMPETCDYIYIGLIFSILLTLIPIFCRLCEATIDLETTEINYLELPQLLWEKASYSFLKIFSFAFGSKKWQQIVLIIGLIQRLFLTLLLFFLFTVAERTFKQRFLYAKLFSHLTSSRRARKSELPHFRLNKVRNIKTWLSVRSYLKRRGPQRSIDVIVSAAFIFTLLLLAFLSVEWLKDSVHLHSQFNLEALFWATALGVFLLRFMTLGNKINRKYRSVSVLITEQINLYLQIEQKPKKKDELMVSNSVLKLAADLLKELESPFKISGLSANPYLYTTVKVVIMSALSGVLSEMLGFKLKLHKIKIK